MPIAPSEKPAGAPQPFQPAAGQFVTVIEDSAGNPILQFDDLTPRTDFTDLVNLSGGAILKTSTFNRLNASGNDPGDIIFNGNAGLVDNIAPAVDPTDAPTLGQTSPLFTITAGALPTQQFVSGTAAQVSTTRDVEVHTPVTMNSLVATIATCTVALSSDNVTFSTLCIWTEPVGVALAGTIIDAHVRVPAGWYLKYTTAQAVLGLSTYY